MLTKRLATLFAGMLFLSLAVVIGARTDENEIPSPRHSDRRIVRVATVETGGAGREVRFPGITRSSDRAELAFTIPARILTRTVDVGDRVHEGQIIAKLDDRQFRLAERQAAAARAEVEARLEQARRDEARVSRLADRRAATREELEQVRAGKTSLEAALDAAAAHHDETRRLMKETALVAPFDGTITAVRLEPGEWAAPGMPVVEMAGSKGFEVEFEVPETVRPGVRLGSAVRVDLPMLRKSVQGRVSSVARSTSGAGRLFPVVVTLDAGGDLVSGLAAEVVLSLDEKPEITVPLSAVLDSGSSHPSVFKISNGSAERVSIEPGRVIGDRLTVVADGLAQGDEVCVVGQTALVDGDLVEVR